jgi:hypothetical protein
MRAMSDAQTGREYRRAVPTFLSNFKEHPQSAPLATSAHCIAG